MKCDLCPRDCKVDRSEGKIGYCGMTNRLKVARAALHMWEEPVISGNNGSGAVFFSGCPLRCVFCQNHNIAIGINGKEISVERLVEIFFELKEKGANNINLVTPTHFILQIRDALMIAKSKQLNLPIVYNTGSYENVESLKSLEGLIDIYLPDLKYFSSQISEKYAAAPDYFAKAVAAIEEMYRQVGKPMFYKEGTSYDPVEYNPEDANILMGKGVIIRHLLLPGCREDAKKILEYIHQKYGDSVYISIMNQYTPLKTVETFPELTKRVEKEEYDQVVDYAIDIGVENGFIQEGDTADDRFIPEFGNQGV